MFWWILGLIAMAFFLVRGIEQLLEEWPDNPWWKKAIAVGVCFLWLAGTLRVGYEAFMAILF